MRGVEVIIDGRDAALHRACDEGVAMGTSRFLAGTNRSDTPTAYSNSEPPGSDAEAGGDTAEVVADDDLGARQALRQPVGHDR